MRWWIFLLLPVLLAAQNNFNITGRISLRTLNTTYDTKSTIKPDSIADSAYAKGPLIPGLEQNLNIALFARTSKMDITLLGDLRNNQWDQLNKFKNVNRLSLNIRFGRNEIILGDFFDSGSEFFIQSREVRGARALLNLSNLWGADSYWRFKFSGGQIQKALGIGQRLYGLYHQYENAGQYRRFFASGLTQVGDNRYFEVGLKYLYARDDQKSISESINEPLINRNIGGNALLYLWQKHIQLFAEGYASRKDTITAKNINDFAYKGGMDFRYRNFKLVTFYQRLGYDYYTAGYPFLQNDRQGLKFTTAYYIPHTLILSAEGENYHDNLNKDDQRPTTRTRMIQTGITTAMKSWPEITLRWQFRDDNSDVILDTVKTRKISRTLEGRIAFGHGSQRISLSALYIDLNDHSVLISGEPLGTDQLIGSMNFYFRLAGRLYFSGGTVYSQLNLSNHQSNRNLYTYTSWRWDLIPRRLKMEGSINFILNDAANGGYQDYLSDYNQIGSRFSMEYFFNDNISLKMIGGTDFRNMGYSQQQALQVIADPDYGPLFFNSYETYKGWQYGLELNWIF